MITPMLKNTYKCKNCNVLIYTVKQLQDHENDGHIVSMVKWQGEQVVSHNDNC